MTQSRYGLDIKAIMFFFVDSAADWIEKVDKNQHPVPIKMDVGGLWELAEIQHFPELQGSLKMEKKLAAVKANLEKYIKTDYCQYLLDLGEIFTTTNAQEKYLTLFLF